MEAGVRSRFVDLPGGRVHLREAGKGAPLLLLHGIAGNADDWGAVIPALAREWRVVAPDAPGHGRSPAPDDGEVWDLPRYARFLRDMIDHLGGGPVPVAALSGGGAAALGLVTAHPERVSRLALVSSAGLGREVSWGYRMASVAGPLVRAALPRTTPTIAWAFARRLCFDPARVPAGWAERRAVSWRVPGVAGAFVATARATVGWRGQRHDFVAELPSIRHEVLIMWGREDPVLPVAHANRAARLLPRATMHVIERCGHMPTWEYPGVVASRLVDFLDANRPDRPDRPVATGSPAPAR